MIKFGLFVDRRTGVRRYLLQGGWIEGVNDRYHPPRAMAMSLPIDDAYRMAQRDEAKGNRMNEPQVRDYLREEGFDNDHLDMIFNGRVRW